MPEETNRVVVDHLARLCLAPDEIAERHLLAEGIDEGCITVVGSTAIDACLRSAELTTSEDVLRRLDVHERDYLVATIHRAENTTPERLSGLLAALDELSATWPVIFPIHPRTARVLAALPRPKNVRLIDPLGYVQMMQLVRDCRALLTDSGGLQEEAAVLGAPTFILRDETEWMAFVDAGHHLLVGTEPARITRLVRETLTGGTQEQRMRTPIGRERAGATERVLDAMTRFWEGQTAWIRPLSTSSSAPGGALATANGHRAERVRI
jgi:UDP-N-acetylglucosamine 2-epimerase (non-hydrolysing)